MQIKMIWAQAHGGVIGKGGVMPWHLPEDLAHFRAQTAGCPVIMGRKTWASLPERFRPLPGRLNIVVSRQADISELLQGSKTPSKTVFLNDLAPVSADSLHSALYICEQSAAPIAWIMGGGELYAQGMAIAHELVVTHIDAEFEGDVFAPVVDSSWEVFDQDPALGYLTSTTGMRYRFTRYTRTSMIF